MRNLFAHAAVAGATLPAYRRFQRARRGVRAAQEAVLRRILRSQAHSRFGIGHRFSSLSGADEFRRAVPLQSYEDLLPWLARGWETGEPCLTAERPLAYQPTSGTSRGRKLVPCTGLLCREYAAGAQAWLHDLYRHYPGIRRGRHFWSISPPGPDQGRAPDGIPIGFADDAAYLGWPGRFLRPLLVLPPGTGAPPSRDDFPAAAALALAAAADLSLISVWSPTFLLLLLDALENRMEALLRLLHAGTAAGRARAAAVERARAGAGADRARLYRALWPRLSLLSCWADGPSAAAAGMLRQYFPGVPLQPKGICATEGIVSIPLEEAGGAVPAVTSHFLEFLPAGADRTRLAHELEPGAAYSVVLTTGGGFYRYRLGDTVRVLRRHGELPVLRFVGRAHISDRVGEKLHEEEAAEAVREGLATAALDPPFWLVAPEADGHRWFYTLFLESGPLSPRQARILEAAVEGRFLQNFHYRLARDLGQLLPLRIFQINCGGLESYYRRLGAEGLRLGDIKLLALDRREGWAPWFTGGFVPAPAATPEAAPCA